MKKIFITYGNDKYEKAKKRLINSAKKTQYFDEILSFSPENIDNEYYLKHKDILNISRGNGLWLWKPYFINLMLDKMEFNDILFYCDSGAFFLKSPERIEETLEDIFVSDIPLIEKQFTKSKVFDLLNCSSEIKDSNQIIATYIIVRKTIRTVEIMKNWLNLCENFDLIGPSNKENEEEYFISHREDQSLLSITCKKYGIEPHSDITHRYYLPYTYWKNDYFFQLNKREKETIVLFLHKLPNPSNFSLIKILVRQIILNFINLIKFKTRCKKNEKQIY